jgi:predicted DNA-binding transcriptional regulator AlpA
MECDLVGVAEIAAMLSVTRTRIGQLAKSSSFPEPIARLAAGPVWRRSDIELWARETGRL